MDAEAGRLRLTSAQVQAWPGETLIQKQTKQSKGNQTFIQIIQI